MVARRRAARKRTSPVREYAQRMSECADNRVSERRARRARRGLEVAVECR